MTKIAVKQVNSYSLIWNDQKSGGKYNGAFYKPNMPTGYYPIGHYAQNNYTQPTQKMLAVKALEDGALAHPIDFELIWTDKHSGSRMDGSMWSPVAPKGFKALGYVCQSGYNKPSKDSIVCVRQDLVTAGQAGEFIWDDEGTGARGDFGAWKIIGNDHNAMFGNTFIGVSSHSKPTVGMYCLNANEVQLSPPKTQDELIPIIQRYAPIIYFNNKEQYLMTSAEKFIAGANIVNNLTKESIPARLDNLPTGKENEGKYHLEIRDNLVRNGDLTSAKTYVHVRVSDGIYLDIQYWFLYGYNGPGAARIKTLVMDSTAHSGNSSLTPLGEHEGDWEHITVRVSLFSLEAIKIYFSQHSGGQWVNFSDAEVEHGRLVIYSSLNGHASYPHQGNNYTEHRKYPDPAIPAGLEFFLINETNKGQLLDCSNAFELVAADFLDNQPEEPNWLNFLNRWGKSEEAHLTPQAVQGVLDDALGIFGKVFGYVNMLGILLKVLLPLFVKENQDGPTGPKTKGSWSGNE